MVVAALVFVVALLVLWAFVHVAVVWAVVFAVLAAIVALALLGRFRGV